MNELSSLSIKHASAGRLQHMSDRLFPSLKEALECQSSNLLRCQPFN